ncbi:MAG: class I SAM-dependent methyltransferase [Promethearchaeota archaeon]
MKKNTEHFEILSQYWDKKSDRELNREEFDPRKFVHTELLWREIKRVMDGRKNLRILDAGAGPGRFSIPLAQEGHILTHLDISAEMLKIAEERAQSHKISNISFYQCSICEPLPFPDNSFDVVLCLDSPLSYCPHNYSSVIDELLRVSDSSVTLCVVNRLGAILEDGGNFDLEHFEQLKTIKSVFSTGVLEVDEEMRKLEPSLMPSWRAFTPSELQHLFEEKNWVVEHISAPGTFVRFVDPELLKKLVKHPNEFRDYVDFAAKFDSEPMVLGVGAVNAGGLLVTAKKES